MPRGGSGIHRAVGARRRDAVAATNYRERAMADPRPTPDQPALVLGALALGMVGAALSSVAPVVAVALGVVALSGGVLAVVGAGDDGRRRGLGIGALVLGALAIGLGALVAVTGEDEDEQQLVYLAGIATATPDDDDAPQDDVAKPLACRVEIGVVRAGGNVTNSTGNSVRYTIAVVWEQDGATIASTTTVLEPVTPGQTRTFEVVAPGEGTSGTVCRITRVDRSAL